MKTLNEWVCSFPEPYRSQFREAITRQGRENRWTQEYPNAAGAVGGISFFNTAQTNPYWLEFHGRMEARDRAEAGRKARLDAGLPAEDENPEFKPGDRVKSKDSGRTGTLEQRSDSNPGILRWYIRSDTGGNLFSTSERNLIRLDAEPPENSGLGLGARVRGKIRGHTGTVNDMRPEGSDERWQIFWDTNEISWEGDDVLELINNETQNPTEKDTETMKNGTYSAAKLIAKCGKELKANETAVAQSKKDAAERQDTLAITRKLLKDLGADLPVAGKKAVLKSLTVSFTGPAVTDHTARLKSILRDLSALAGDEITWNEDIDFVLQDFTKANGSETYTVDVIVEPPKE